MDLQAAILTRIAAARLTRNALAKKLKGCVPRSSLYAFLSGDRDICSSYLGAIFDVLGIGLDVPSATPLPATPRKRPPPLPDLQEANKAYYAKLASPEYADLQRKVPAWLGPIRLPGDGFAPLPSPPIL